MNPMKLKLLEEILSHLSDSQAGDLKSLLDESNKPEMTEGSPEEEAMESPKDEIMEDGKPKGISVEKVQLSGKPEDKMPGEEDMSDDELSELVKKYLG